MDTYGAGLSVMVIALFELVAIMWGYGVNNFCKDLRSMLGFSPSWYFKLCWFLVSPVALITIFIAGCADWKKPSYGAVEYPDWAHTIGWILMLLSVIQIPLWFIIKTCMCLIEGNCKELKAFKPAKSWTARRDQGDVNNSTFICKKSKPLSELSFRSYVPPTMDLKLPKV